MLSKTKHFLYKHKHTHSSLCKPRRRKVFDTHSMWFELWGFHFFLSFVRFTSHTLCCSRLFIFFSPRIMPLVMCNKLLNWRVARVWWQEGDRAHSLAMGGIQQQQQHQHQLQLESITIMPRWHNSAVLKAPHKHFVAISKNNFKTMPSMWMWWRALYYDNDDDGSVTQAKIWEYFKKGSQKTLC